MTQISRRELLRLGVLGTGAAALAACMPPAGTTPSGDVSAPAGGTQTDQKVTIRFLTRQGANGSHHREFAKRYADSTDGRVTVETEEVPWGEVSKSLETGYITGTMVDATWGDNAWWPRLASIGAFLVIEDMVEASGMDLSKWFNVDWFKRWTDGKLSGLGGCAGSSDLVTFYNREWVKEAWGKEPTDDWTINDWYEMQVACVDAKGGPGNGFFGEIPQAGGHHGSHGYYSRFGAGLLDREGKVCTFSDEGCQEAIKFVMNGVSSGVMPGREDQAEGAFQMFMAGKVCSRTSNPGASNGMVAGAEENGIDMGVVLGPKGPVCETAPAAGPCMVHSPYTNTFGVYSGTKHPQEAFDVLKMVASVESMVWLCLETGKQPGAQLDSWRDPRIAEKFPWFPKVAQILEDESNAWFPMPWNTRYWEWRDVGDNEISALVYGDVPYNQANIDAITDHTQMVLDLPRPPKPAV